MIEFHKLVSQGNLSSPWLTRRLMEAEWTRTMYHRFTASEQIAVKFILKLERGGTIDWNPELPTPVWTNFTFFSKIIPGAIELKWRIEPTNGRKELPSRSVR